MATPTHVLLAHYDQPARPRCARRPAACQVITLDTAGANYRSVWAMHKHFPHIKTFVRAFDIENGGWRGGGRGALAVLHGLRERAAPVLGFTN